MGRLEEHMERCVRCSACKAECPTYAASHMEGVSARGRVMLVRALINGELKPTKTLAQRLYSCMLCGLCEPLCPVGVDITGIIYEGLRLTSSHDPRGTIKRRLAKEAFTNTERAFGLGKFLKPMLPLSPFKGALAPFDVTLPETTLRSEGMLYMPKNGSANESPENESVGEVSMEPKGRVAVFVGCAANYIYPHMGRALIKILNNMGYEVVLPEGEVCCGAPLRAMGMEDEAKELAAKNIEVFNELDVHAVLSPCPTCTLTIKKHYPELIGQGIEGAQDPLEFLASLIAQGTEELPQVSVNGPVMYHEPCHLASGLGAGNKAREVMHAIGLKFTEPDKRICCGFGLQSVYPEDSEAQLERLEFFKEPDKGTLVTACPGCAAQLARSHGNVSHVLELIADQL